MVQGEADEFLKLEEDMKDNAEAISDKIYDFVGDIYNKVNDKY